MSNQKRRTRLIWRTVILALAAIVLGVNLYSWNASGLLNDSLPMPFGFGVSVVLSGSMEPELSVGDLIVVVRTEEIREQDIIVYQDGGLPIVHRVIGIDGETIVTMGDANDVADEPITAEQVKGRLLFALPAVGNMVLWLRKPTSVLLMLAAVLLFTELSFRKEKDSKQAELKEIENEIRRLTDELKK